jgi:hypothetical protein
MAAFAAPPRLLDLLDRLAPFARLGVLHGTADLARARAHGRNDSVLSLDWPELERVLPDRGFPRGVIEIASPMTRMTPMTPMTRMTRTTKPAAPRPTAMMRGGATTIALSAIRAVHADPSTSAWCAWITEADAPPLYAPAVAQAGVDLDRLLVVRPSHADLARTAVKVAASGAFDIVVVDAASGLDGKLAIRSGARAVPRVDGSVVIRKLALAAEEKGTTFLVLTNIFTSRAVPWPVALRIEVERRPEAIAVRVTKDRRGRASSQHVIRWPAA